jgi:L-amino acid N-acyltransferase YncA
MNIRLATEADLPVINRIYNATIPSGMVTADTSPPSAESRLEWFSTHHALRPIWVATDAEQVIGYMSFKNFYGRPAYAGTAEISVYIDEAYRYRQVGQAFIQYAFEQAPALRIHTLLAFIFGHNEPSIRFFRKHGFEPYGRLPGVAEMNGRFYDLAILGRKL